MWTFCEITLITRKLEKTIAQKKMTLKGRLKYSIVKWCMEETNDMFIDNVEGDKDVLYILHHNILLSSTYH